MQIRQLHGAVIALRIEKVHQRRAAMLVGISHGVAHSRGLVLVLRLVRLEERDIALHLRIGRIHVAEDLSACGLAGLLAAVDVDERALLFALVVIEDTQRNIHAGADCLCPIGVIV